MSNTTAKVMNKLGESLKYLLLKRGICLAEIVFICVLKWPKKQGDSEGFLICFKNKVGSLKKS
jgi:hypothetical protein